MTAYVKKPTFITKSGRALAVAPGTENPVSVDEMRKRRDAWYERNKKYLTGYSVDDFITEKRLDVLTPNDIPEKFREQVLTEAQPV